MDGSNHFAHSKVHLDIDRSEPLVIVRPSAERLAASKGSASSFSSIHFRDEAPSIYYTVSNSILTLSCLDTDQKATVLDFGTTIRNVGLHDDSVNLILHVFMDTFILYSMILTPKNLEQPEVKKEPGWITEYLAPSFQIRDPLYMQTISATSIIFSLRDGGLLRLSNNGQGYNEHIFSDSSYFTSFKSILPWSGRPSNLVISIQACPARNLLFTLSVDARLKVWDISKGRLLGVYETYAHQSPPAFLAEPSESRYLALHEQAAGFLLVTYCPQRPGSFKVFKGRSAELEEVFSFAEEQPPDGVWRIFDFAISNMEADGNFRLDVLWKLDTLMLLQTARVSLTNRRVVWSFATESAIFAEIPSKTTEVLEDFIFRSKQFALDTLRSAVATLDRDASSAALKARNYGEMQRIVKGKLESAIRKTIDEETGNVLEDKYAEDLRLQYLNFAQICAELDRTACEPHAILYCSYTKETIIAQTAQISFLRKACALEGLLQQAQSNGIVDSAQTHCLRAAMILRDGLSIDSWLIIADVLQDVSLADRTMSADDAMFLTYERTIENQLQPATVASLAETSSSEHLFQGLRDLMPYLQQSLSERVVEGVLGTETYIATKRSNHELARDMGAVLLSYLTYIACTSGNIDPYQASGLFINYLQVFRQNALACEVMTSFIEPVGDAQHLTYITATEGKPVKTEASNSVMLEVLKSSTSQISSRDLLERTLICLLNLEQGSLAVQLSRFIIDSPLSCYLRARSLLQVGDFSQAASQFARIAHPLVTSPGSRNEGHLIVKLQSSGLAAFYLHVAALFLDASQASYAVRFCNEALLASTTSSPEREADIQEKKFIASIEAKDWSEAYNAVASGQLASQKEKLRHLVTELCEAGAAHVLQTLPCVGIVEDIDAVLESKARNMLDVRTNPSYHKILYAFRTSHGDYRGAAGILYHRLQFLQNRTHVNGFNVADHLEITEGYLAIINALRCLDTDDAWVIVGSIGQDTPSVKRTKTNAGDESSQEVIRKVLKLSDIQAEYNRELRNMEAQLIALREFDD